MDSSDVLELIKRYVAAVDRATHELRLQLGHSDLLAAAKNGLVPRSGRLEGLRYTFHGVGCTVEFDDVCIDFDFGPRGRHGGFDAWRLSRFAAQDGESGAESDEIQRGLDELVASGFIVKSEGLPSPHLYYLGKSP